jgi:hypothetical protein
MRKSHKSRRNPAGGWESPSFDREPRCAHYTLAHYALREASLSDPLLYLAILASPQRQMFLEKLLESVVESCAEQNEPDFAASDLKVHCLRINRYPCAIVELPPPRAFAEAFFTALIACVDPSGPIPDRSSVNAHYYTLECGVSMDGSPRTVLAEWTRDGTHNNFGDGPAPTLDDFVTRLRGSAPSDR